MKSISEEKAHLADIVTAMRAKGYTIAEAEKAVKDVFKCTEDLLVGGKDVVATGFGTFYRKLNKAKNAPSKPGEPIRVGSETVTIGFIAAQPVRKRLRR